MKSLIVLVFATLCMTHAAPSEAGQVAGEGPPPLELTLDDAIARGLAASHRIVEAFARRDAADAGIEARHAAALPQVAALGGYARTNHVEAFGVPLPNNQLRIIYPDIPDNYRTRVDVQWPIYTGGRLDALTQAARMEASASTADVDALRADLRFAIARAFWSLFVADQSQHVFAESLARASVLVQDVRNQLEAGLVAPNEVLSAQAQESRQRMLAVQARSARDVAEAELARLVGVAPGTAIRPDAPLEPVGVDATIGALVAQATADRRDRRALLDRLSGAQSREDAATAGRRPTIGVAGGVDYARPNARIFPRQGSWRESWDASVNVSWPIFDGGRTRAEVAEAAASRRAVQARLDELDSVLALEVRQSVAEIEASRAAIAAAEDGVLAATEAHRVVGERFRAGVATSTDVLSAQLAITQALLDRTQALVNSRLAQARLHRALGQ